MTNTIHPKELENVITKLISTDKPLKSVLAGKAPEAARNMTLLTLFNQVASCKPTLAQVQDASSSVPTLR